MIYRAAIVGCGRVGCQFDDERWPQVRTHAGAYARTAGVELVALADVDEEKLIGCGEKFGVPGRYTDFREMMARERPDLVSVCTKSDQHADIIGEAVRHGVRGIVCEKPFTRSVEDADDAIARCEQAGVVLLVNHPRRFDMFHHRLAAWLRDGGLGRLQYVAAWYSAGALNTGTHLFDILRLYVGEVAWVRGLLSPNASGDETDPNIDIWLGFESGLHAAVHACDARAFVAFEIMLAGTEGRIHITSVGFDVDVRYERAGRSERSPGYRTLAPAALPLDAARSQELMLHVVENLVACVDGVSPPLCSGRDGRAALAVACAARASAIENGHLVAVPAALEPHHAR